LDGQRQRNIDFHSFRRWFVRKAKGFSPWAIAELIGHAVENASLEASSCR
jgi:hypothetical protein